jgi:HEAT repeat protein
MRTTSSLLLVLSSLPASLAAQAASTRTVQVPDLSWLTPAIAQARVGAAIALSQAGPAIAAAGPALTQARGGLLRAQAALARSGWRLSANAERLAVSGRSFGQQLAETPPAPWAQQDPADQLYRDARAALNRGRYSSAADLFAQIYAKYPRSSYAGDAYYWQAYALSKRSSDAALEKALDVLSVQGQKAPNASTRSDAEALATRIRGQLARGGNADAAAVITETARRAETPVASASPSPSRTIVSTKRGQGGPSRDRCGDEDDIQGAALNALQQMDADKALPILKRVLARRDEGSECLRRKAIFIVSQHEGPETERILLEAARSDPDQEVREQAVFWLSQVDSPTAVSALDSILRGASDPVLQEKAIFALSQQDSPKARQALRDFALRGGVSDELREKAIFWIGQGDDPDRLGFLKTLYGSLKSETLKDKILFSISQIDGRESSQWLLGVAGDVNENIELRKKALFWVGQSDYPLSELSTLYEKMPSREMKEQLIFVYSQRNEKAAVDRLIQIARTEPDRELRKKAIFWLSQSSDPRVAEFLASLLEKP